MPNPNSIRIKRSNTAANSPSSLFNGELAANISDQKLWIGNSSNTPILLSDITNTFVYQGDWDLGVNYKKNDVVKRNGIFYMTLHPIANNGPDPQTNNGVDWQILSNPAGGGIALTDISSSAVGLNYNYTTGNFSISEGYEIPLTSTLSSITTAYNERLQWDGGATNLVTATGRTSLGIDAVENTALSTWAGSTNITTVGAVTTKTLTVTPVAGTGTQSPSLTITAPSHTALTASTEYSDLNINLSRTVQFATGALTTQRAIKISAPVYSAVAASTITTAATLSIEGPPNAGSNVTITNPVALNVGTNNGIGIIIAGVQNQSADLFRANVTGIDSTTFISTTRPALTISSSGALVLNPTNSSAGSTNQLRFLELAANGTNYVGFKAPDTIASNIIWTLPSSDGTSGNVLSTNGSGNLSWIAASSGGSSVTTSATAPASPTAGNQWYDTNTGIIYTYINDGTSSQWVQGSTATLDTGVPAGGTINQFLVKSGATDYATAWTGTLTNPTFTNYTETMFEVAGSGTWSINLSQGTVQKFYYNGNFTLTLPTSVAGKSFIIIVQYQTNGLSTTWSSPSPLKWVGGTTPTATGVSGKIDIFSFFQDGTNTYGTVYGQNF